MQFCHLSGFCLDTITSYVDQAFHSVCTDDCYMHPLKLHLTTSELWFGQEQEGILPELLSSSSSIV